MSEMQRTAKVFSPVVIILASALGVWAQVLTPFSTPTPTPAPTPKPASETKVYPCPSVSVQPLVQRQVREGQPVGFVVNLAGGDPKVAPTIVWNTSAGTITQGQGSRRIIVDTTGAAAYPDREIKADVWVGGYAPECVLQGSASTKVIPPATKFGDFGELPDKQVSENLKALSEYISQIPNDNNIWLIVYAGRDSERGYSYTRAKKLKDELIADGVAARRIIALDGGYMEKPLFDFWIVPFGAQPPTPKPTIDRREIINRKTPPKQPQG